MLDVHMPISSIAILILLPDLQHLFFGIFDILQLNYQAWLTQPLCLSIDSFYPGNVFIFFLSQS